MFMLNKLFESESESDPGGEIRDFDHFTAISK